jgi:Tfp pilus assembly protein PilO
MKDLKVFLRPAFGRIRAEYRRSPFVSVGVFLILVIVAFAGISRVTGAGIERQEAEARLLAKRLEYRQSLIRNRDRLEKDLAGLEGSRQFIMSKVFTEASDDLAFSRIQQGLEKVAAMQTISIKSYKFEATRRTGNFSILPVSLDFAAPYGDAVTFLNLIEKFPQFLKATDIEMRCLGGDENVTVRLIVEGYRYHEKKAS